MLPFGGEAETDATGRYTIRGGPYGRPFRLEFRNGDFGEITPEIKCDIGGLQLGSSSPFPMPAIELYRGKRVGHPDVPLGLLPGLDRVVVPGPTFSRTSFVVDKGCGPARELICTAPTAPAFPGATVVACGSREIWDVPRQAGPPKLLASEFARVFSPRGNYVVFVDASGLMNLIDVRARHTRSLSVRPASWSRLKFASDESSFAMVTDQNVLLIFPLGGNGTELAVEVATLTVSGSPGTELDLIEYSPDGRWLAFPENECSFGCQLRLASVTGSVRSLGQAIGTHHRFSLDSEYLFATRYAVLPSARETLSFPVDGRPPRGFLPPTTDIPVPIPGGTRVAYATFTGTVVFADAAGGDSTGSVPGQGVAATTPDGRWAFIRMGQQQKVLSLSDLSEKATVMSDSFSDLRVISADSRFAAFVGGPSRLDIFLLSLEAGAAVAAVDTVSRQPRNLQFSSDGRWLAYDDDRQLKMLSTSGGSPTVLTSRHRQPGDFGWLSSDGIVTWLEDLPPYEGNFLSGAHLLTPP